MNYHVNYNPIEDRLLISIEVTPEQEYAMGLTRRLTKLLLGTLADLQTKKKIAELEAEKKTASPPVRRKLETIRQDPVVRDTVLKFEHGHAVAASAASGDTQPRQQAKPLIAPPKVVQEVKVTPKPDGGAIIKLDDRQRILTLDLNVRRVHSLMAGVLDIATKAGWDLPVNAAWLAGGATKATDLATIVH